MASVKFLQGTRAQYASITPDINTFYTVTETDGKVNFYLGSLQLSQQAAIDVLNGADTVPGSVANAIKVAIADIKTTLIAEGKTDYGGGFELYSLGNLLLIKHIPGTIATGSSSNKKTLFEYGEQYPAVSEDEDRKLPNGITLTLTTDRKVKYSTPYTITSGSYIVEPGIDIFMTNAGVGPVFNPITTVVTELPTEDIKSDTMYFLKKSDGTFEQYMYVENSWVKIGGDYSDGNGVAY